MHGLVAKSRSNTEQKSTKAGRTSTLSKHYLPTTGNGAHRRARAFGSLVNVAQIDELSKTQAIISVIYRRISPPNKLSIGKRSIHSHVSIPGVPACCRIVAALPHNLQGTEAVSDCFRTLKSLLWRL